MHKKRSDLVSATYIMPFAVVIALSDSPFTSMSSRIVPERGSLTFCFALLLENAAHAHQPETPPRIPNPSPRGWC